MDAPREQLIRKAAPPIVEGRTLTGYPIVFNSWTTINSWEGQFKERVAPTALRKTLKESSDQIKVLFNHGMGPMGDMPLGKPTVMRTDDRGLYVEVPLSETTYNDDLLALMRDGAIDGQSFRFSVVQEEWEHPKRGLPERTLTEVRLHEFGPVTFPAYQATTVGIRSREHFDAWRGLTSETRDEIARLMGISFDLRTLDDEAADGTSDDRAATEDLEPQVQHSSSHLTRHAALAALAKLKELAR